MLAYGEALAGTGRPLVVSGSIGSPTNEGWPAPKAHVLGRPATEEDPALPGGDAYKGTVRVRNVVEIAVVSLAERGVRSSIVQASLATGELPPRPTVRRRLNCHVPSLRH